MTFLESQEELLEDATTPVNQWFNSMYPVWRCPDCEMLNRYIDTFFELCGHCKVDHTLDWTDYIVDEEVKKDWQ